MIAMNHSWQPATLSGRHGSPSIGATPLEKFGPDSGQGQAALPGEHGDSSLLRSGPRFWRGRDGGHILSMELKKGDVIGGTPAETDFSTQVQ